MPVVLVTLFIYSFFPILMAGLSLVFRQRQFGRIDNHHPRSQQSELIGTGARVVAAQKNCWETLIIYTLVVFIAESSGVDLHNLDIPALLFLGFRLVYILCYLMDLATARSVAYAGGMACCLYIFYIAATL
ncbi:MAG: MAPEG family protein [Oceanospirillales bacterium]|nr:MAPEG family protein [Oceanospirillales bacterium]